MSERTAPRWAEKLLAACLPEDEREAVLGDLEEESRSRGRAWYWRQALSLAARFLALRALEREAASTREPRTKGERMGQLLRDLKHGGRVLLRKPGFALTAVLTLALGIGANAAIFSVVYGVLLHPLPYFESERLVTAWETDARRPSERLLVSPATFLAWRERGRSAVGSVAAVSPWAVEYTGGDEPESIDGVLVTEGFFQVLGVEAFRGRTFLPEEHRQGAPKVLVLSHGLWQRRFGGDEGLVGRTLAFGRDSYQIVGILPPDFRSPAYGGGVYSPLAFRAGAERSRFQYMRAVARLRPGVLVATAQSALDAVNAQLAAEQPQQALPGGVLVPVLDQIVGPVRPALLTLFGAALLILLIACANVAHLQLARASERRREFAIRVALGAERARLVRQLVTESVWLVLAAAAFGVALAHWGIAALRALAPAGLPRLEVVRLDAPVFLFGALLALLTLLLFGLVPALQASRSNLQPSLKEGSGAASAGRATHRLRSSLVVWEVALALVLMVGATLLTRSFVSLLRVNPGFSSENVVSLQVFVYGRYPKPEQQLEYFRQALGELQATPGVESAGAVSFQPFLFGSPSTTAVAAEGEPAAPTGQEPVAVGIIAAGDYFRAAGIPVLRGRAFAAHDTPSSAPAVVVSQSLARRLWGERDPIGRTLTARGPAVSARFEVVGVVGDVRHALLSEPPLPSFYRPFAQSPYGGMSFVVKTRSAVAERLPEIKRAIWRVNRQQPFYRVATVDELVARSLLQRRFVLSLLGLFASLALLLATVGIYGVISFVTAQRTREIGLRVALGATPAEILRLVMGEGVGLAVTGVGLGCLAALGLSRFLQGQLFGVSPLDPATYVATGALLLSVAALASYLPARRALRGNPVAVLRQE